MIAFMMASSLRRVIFSGDDDYYTSIAAVPAPAPALEPMMLIDSEDPNQHITFIVLASASVVATCFLLLSYYIILLRRGYSIPNHRHNTPYEDDDDDDDENAGNYFWYVKTAGLDSTTIGSIPFFAFDGCDGNIKCSDCSVCLSEFKKGELVRLLPKCSHAFHLECIDMWLGSHVNCPLCRVPIITRPSTLVAASAFADESSSSLHVSGGGDGSGVVNGDVGPTPLDTPLEVGGGGEEMGNGSWTVVFVDGDGSSTSSSLLQSGSQEQSNLGDGDRELCVAQRSMLLGSTALDGFEVTIRVEGNGKLLIADDSVEENDCRQKEAIETERAGNSSNSFLSRFNCRTNSSVLPS